MKYRLLLQACLYVLAILAGACIHAQQTGIRGRVIDRNTGESLPGVNIVIDSTRLAVSDDEGYFHHDPGAGMHSLVFTYIGYRAKTISLKTDSGELVKLTVYLQPVSIELNTAVISASRYEQRLSDVVVSMEVLPSSYIETVNTMNLDESLSLVPGMDIIDGQANIRGGSGYTYGAGSRVLVLLDGLPILTGGVDDVKWNSLPTEIIEQAEIIKGASSALYGSSALNGVVNLRTARPGIKPLTRASFSMGAYMKPKREEMAWFWDRNPLFGNLQFSHLRKAGPFDLSVSGSGLYDEGYRQDNDMRYGRLNAGVRFSPAKTNALSAGLNTGFQMQSLSDFLIWQDADSGAYMQNPEAVSPMEGKRFNLDPYAVYFDASGGRHSLNTRIYVVENQFDEDADKNNNSTVYLGEYRYQKAFFDRLNCSVGAVFSYTESKTSLYGNHFGSTQALYAQLDYTFFGRLGSSLGFRWERYTLDNTDKASRPVFRAGMNYRAAEKTFLRTSIGQGYRYPSMAEKYTSTSLGGLRIFPNPGLEPETGWSAEIGIKQGFSRSHWSGFVDLAGFWTEYDNMIEFVFGIHHPANEPPGIEYVGFKSLNTGKARINGIDVSTGGRGMAGPLAIQYFAGYTFMNPLDLSPDDTDSTGGEDQILKYRYKHAAKGDISISFRKVELGITGVYRSFMERIDEAFEENILGQYFFPGLKEYRQENNTGSVIFDLRIAWQFSPASKIALHIKNLFNTEYMGRPGDIYPPQNLSLQYILQVK